MMSSSEKYGVLGFNCVKDRGCSEKYFWEKLQFRSAKGTFAERRSEIYRASLSELRLR